MSRDTLYAEAPGRYVYLDGVEIAHCSDGVAALLIAYGLNLALLTEGKVARIVADAVQKGAACRCQFREGWGIYAYCPKCVAELEDEIDRLRSAQGTEAQRAETSLGSVHDGPVAESDAPNPSQSTPKIEDGDNG